MGCRAQLDALAVPCSWCRVPVGELCVNRDTGDLFKALPAHQCRINGARRVASVVS